MLTLPKIWILSGWRNIHASLYGTEWFLNRVISTDDLFNSRCTVMLLNGFHFKTEEIDLLLYSLLQQDGFYGYSLIGTLFFPCWQQYRKLNSHLFFCISINVKPGEWFPDLALRAEFGSLSPSASHLRSWGGWWWKGKKRRAFLWAHGWGMGHRKQAACLCEKGGEDKAECKHINCLFRVWHNCKNMSQVLATKVLDLIASAWNLAKYCPICFNEWVRLRHSEENLLPFHFAAMHRKI